MVACRHFEIYKNLITPEPFVRFSPNLVRSFVLTLPRRRMGQNCHFSKSKMAADEKLKFTKNLITWKRFVLYAPNLVCIIYYAPGTSLWSPNLEIHNPRWPPAAILKFTKTYWRTVCPILTKCDPPRPNRSDVAENDFEIRSSKAS